MAGRKAADLAQMPRHRFVLEDPVRFACLCAVGALVLAPEIPFALTLLVVAAVQMAPILMAARAVEPGWSRRWGRFVHESVFASHLAMDFTHLASCSVVGALLLVRHFNGTEVVRPLAILGVGICLLPDIRLCRWLLAGDPMEASVRLREGYFYRDPVMLGSLLTAGVICALDATSLYFIMLAILFLQLNTLLVLFDKYLPEIEVGRWSGWKALLFEREGRRFLFCVAPLLLVPVRVYGGDRPALYGAAALAAAVALPDLLRMAWAGVRALFNAFRVTPAPSSPPTYIVLPKAH